MRLDILIMHDALAHDDPSNFVLQQLVPLDL